MHGRFEHVVLDVGHQLPGFHVEDLHDVAGFVRHVQMSPVHDDAAHGVAWLAALVQHHREAERVRHIP